MHRMVSLSFAFLSCLPAAWVLAGEREVQAAVVLIEDNHVRAHVLSRRHLAVVRETRLELADLGTSNVRYEPGAREADYFLAEGGVLAREAFGQMVVIRRLLAAEAKSSSEKVVAGAGVVAKLADLHEEYLHKAVESAVDDLSYERMFKELTKINDDYTAQLEEVPFWATTLVARTRFLEDYKDAIKAEQAKIHLNARAGKWGPLARDLDGLWTIQSRRVVRADRNEATISAEEYEAKSKAYEEREAERERYRQERLKQIAERQELESVRGGSSPELTYKAPAAPSKPAGPPADAARVQTWSGSYAVKIQPFKKALGELLALDRSRRSKELATACGNVANLATALMRDRQMISGSRPLDEALTQMLQSYKQVAGDCLGGQFDHLEGGLQNGAAKVGQLAEILKPYGLSP